MNLPKFLNHDLILFEGIIKDLFPNVTPIVAEYDFLNESITYTLDQLKLQNVPSFKLYYLKKKFFLI